MIDGSRHAMAPAAAYNTAVKVKVSSPFAAAASASAVELPRPSCLVNWVIQRPVLKFVSNALEEAVRLKSHERIIAAA